MFVRCFWLEKRNVGVWDGTGVVTRMKIGLYLGINLELLACYIVL